MLSDGRGIAYDAAANRWEILEEAFDPRQGEDFGPAPTSRLHRSIVYDPLNERLVVYGGSYRTPDPDRIWVQANDVLAFDPATGEGTVLLEAGRVGGGPAGRHPR